MNTDVEVTIAAPRDVVWSLVSDIENSAAVLPAIEEVEILERPGAGLLGLKWRETRTIFGKTATETMWVTDVEEGRSYTAEARSHGSIYRTTIRLDDLSGGTRLRMEFSARPVSFGAKLASLLLGFLMRRSVRQALQKDLEDLKRAAEARGAQPTPSTGS